MLTPLRFFNHPYIDLKPQNIYVVLYLGGDWHRTIPGSRIPSVWAGKHGNKEKLLVVSSIGNNANYHIVFEFSKGTKSHLLIHQYHHCDGKDYFEILVDDTSVFKSENTNAVEVGTVKLYASDPWYHSLNGKLENLAYDNQDNKFLFTFLYREMQFHLIFS